jgi:hypothetical protein
MFHVPRVRLQGHVRLILCPDGRQPFHSPCQYHQSQISLLTQTRHKDVLQLLRWSYNTSSRAGVSYLVVARFNIRATGMSQKVINDKLSDFAAQHLPNGFIRAEMHPGKDSAQRSLFCRG